MNSAAASRRRTKSSGEKFLKRPWTGANVPQGGVKSALYTEPLGIDSHGSLRASHRTTIILLPVFAACSYTSLSISLPAISHTKTTLVGYFFAARRAKSPLPAAMHKTTLCDGNSVGDNGRPYSRAVRRVNSSRLTSRSSTAPRDFTNNATLSFCNRTGSRPAPCWVLEAVTLKRSPTCGSQLRRRKRANDSTMASKRSTFVAWLH
mmetsp:Transcript_6035/g.23957  ORF Transcript_6035/g.23957 Transcript_6035/m.23957 type:complete len:206 (+) Transcript_6035:661-1278(+)